MITTVPVRPAATSSKRGRGGRGPAPVFKYLAVAPMVVFFLAMVAVPIGQLIWMSLGDVTLLAGQFQWEPVGLDNFTRMVGDDLFHTSLKNSAVFIFFTVVLTMLLGTVGALAADRLVRGQQLAQNVMIWPAIIAPVVISVVWLLILSPQIGLLNRVLTTLGLSRQTWLGEPLGAMGSVILLDVWHWTPIVFLFVYTALRALDPSVLEAAQVDGAGYLRSVRSIVLPLIAPPLLGVTALRFIMGVKAFDEFYLLTFGGPGTATTVITIYLRSVVFESFDYGYGAALSVTVVAGVLLLVVVALSARRVLGRGSRG